MAFALDERLMAAADFVRENSRLADIGSDHAYLPIYLCQTGRVSAALASDINEGPISSARENIKESGLCDKIKAVCADGLAKSFDFSPDDITILGMGGELIISIIEAAEWVKDPKIRLILQPMTHAELLYKYLLNNGFSIIGERICSTSVSRDDRIYRIICAEYSGEARECSDVEALVGIKNIERYESEGDSCRLFERYVEKISDVYKTRANGKRHAGRDASTDEKTVAELEEILKKGFVIQ